MPKTTAFIGLAGPFGYDYRNPAPRVNEEDNSSPNPVLENVLGMLLCYDELVFLSPQFCPADLRELPYVRFLTDQPELLAAAGQAMRAYEDDAREDWATYPSFDRFAEISAEMCGTSADEFAIDNHTHGVHLGDLVVSGNGMATDNAVRDLWVAAGLETSHIDVIISSPVQRVLEVELEAEVASGDYFAPVKRSAAEHLVQLQVPNFLGARGSYHDAFEQIRDRSDVAEFRQFLLEFDAPTEDGAALAREISHAAFDRVDELSRRFLKGQHWFQSLGTPALRAIGNYGLPLLGTAVAAGIEAPGKLRDRRLRSNGRWAPFVVALNRPRP